MQTEYKVGDQGWVRYIDHMGSDELIYQVATDTITDATKRSDTRTLLRRMFRHSHGSSFEFGELILQVQCPFYIWRQMIRHRASPFMDESSMFDEPSINELSGRYSKVLDIIEKVSPDQWREQSKSNRQGSAGFLPEIIGETLSIIEIELFDHIIEAYNDLLNNGVAKEQARRLWPMAGYTRGYMKMDIRNWMHFCSLRLPEDAQYEMREFAKPVAAIISELFPICFEALQDYVLEAITFSRQELLLLKYHLQDMEDAYIISDYLPNKTEQNEFKKKLKKILR